MALYKERGDLMKSEDAAADHRPKWAGEQVACQREVVSICAVSAAFWLMRKGDGRASRRLCPPEPPHIRRIRSDEATHSPRSPYTERTISDDVPCSFQVDR